MDGDAWFDYIDAFFDARYLELRIVGREVLVTVAAQCIPFLLPSRAEDLTNKCESWVVLDKFAHKIVGPAVMHGVLPWDLMLSMRATDPAKHGGEADPGGENPSCPGRFFRRCALVASTAFNFRDDTDVERPLELLNAAVCRDRDTMTWKALSWTLRSLAKKSPVHAQRFLDHPPAALHPSVVREVGNVIRTGRKSG